MVKDLHIKMRYHHSPIKMAEIKKSVRVVARQGQELSLIASRNVKWHSYFGSFSQTNTILP